jgi:hypothetical protein
MALFIRIEKELSPSDFDSLHSFVFAEIKKFTGLQSERIPFVISLADEHQKAGSTYLSIRWAVYEDPQTAELQRIYREDKQCILDFLNLPHSDHLGFVFVAESLVFQFIELYFSI